MFFDARVDLSCAVSAWLKPLGAAGAPLDNHWLKARSDLLIGVDFPSEPRSVTVGDKLVLYASTHRRIFGVAEVASDPYLANRHPRWPYRCDIRMLLAVPLLQEAPLLDELIARGGRDLYLSVRQKPYVRLTDREYLRAVQALTAPLYVGASAGV
jgi:hypothetical protein